MTAAGSSPGAACVLLRVWLPDRPGALGAVASRIGAVRGDIVGIDVLERGDGVAIDEFGVVLADVELLDALLSVALVCEADDPGALQKTLATYAGTAFGADWVAVMDPDQVLAACGNPPADSYLIALARIADHLWRRLEARYASPTTAG